MEKETKGLKNVYGVKIILVGDTQVGKTQILYRFIHKEFQDVSASTIGSDIELFNVELKNKILKLTIMDTAGEERFRSITRGYFTNVPCAIIVYDITNKGTFNSVKQWINDCQSYGSKNIHLILVGNKIDLSDSRKVSKEEGIELANEYCMDFLESSAKTGENIEKIFKKICEFISKNIDEGKYDFNNPSHGVKRLEIEENLKINKSLNKEANIDKKRHNKCCE